MGRITLSQEIQTRREPSLVEVIISINNELFVVSKAMNFLSGCFLAI